MVDVRSREPKSRLGIIIGGVAILVVGGFLGYILPHSQSATSQLVPLRVKSGYDYISPLLTCGTLGPQDSQKFGPLSKSFDAFINKAIGDGRASRIAVYFRDLTVSRWVGDYEDEHYAPASLFKIPVMIAYFRKAETEPDILAKRLTFDGMAGTQTVQNILPGQTLAHGGSYAVDDLIARMIMYSDNDAEILLLNNLNPDYLNEVFTDLALDPLALKTGNDSMSAKSFSRFLSVLYNSTYLTRDMSERAIGLLAKSTFTEGIVAGLPSGTTVAHKFGERTFVDSIGQLQSVELHDCGIVYAAEHPYVLCVMTTGKDFTSLKGVIRDVSAMAYKAVLSGK